MKRLLVMVLLSSLVSLSYANCGNDNGNGEGCEGNTIVGSQGPTGPIGPQGPSGSNGSNGQNGSNGSNGQDGKNGNNGKDGKDGKNGSAPDGLNDTRLVADTALRLYDGKRVQWQVFNIYAFGSRPGQDVFGNGKNQSYGVRVIFKLGSSYEERELESLKAQVKLLTSALSRIQ